MKQIIQNLRSGDTLLEEAPVPLVRAGHLLIKTHRSLVSLGTEKMLVEFGRANLISKARQQPERVRQVFEKIKTDGLMPTLEAVFNKLDEPLPLGYCNAGEVIAVGEGVHQFAVGDRVASNGPHAEFVCVPKNLCARIPDNVSYEEAAFTVIGSIGLQGIRLLNPTLGETIVVVGLGLIGLVSAELLLAHGCEVIGLDFDQQKVELAAAKGVKAFNVAGGADPVKIVEGLTEGIGADGVLITASSKSNDVITQSARMSRKRGRIVLVGVVGLDLNRADFFKKELTFQVSCSYGPGRYDEDYEQRGNDYPIGYVRWTENRNFSAILSAISKGKLDVKPLITQRTRLEDYQEIYGDLGRNSIASVLEYSAEDLRPGATVVSHGAQSFTGGRGVIGVIGAGNFTKMTMLPALKKSGAALKTIASAGGVSASSLARKYGFAQSTTDYREVLKDRDIDLVMITTRHNLHASMTLEALAAGKHVFVEKPLAIQPEELEQLVEAQRELRMRGPTITVGFNRRFAPLMQQAKQLLGDGRGPMNIVATMNAGPIPAESWVHDPRIGGGRILGEACHFVDLCTFLTGSLVVSVSMSALGGSLAETTDNAIITLKYGDGSQAVVNYFANGSKAYSKERVEIYSQGRTLVMNNFITLEGFGVKGFSRMKSRQDKGHQEQFSRLVRMLKQGGPPLMTFAEIKNTTRATFAAVESCRSGKWIHLS